MAVRSFPLSVSLPRLERRFVVAGLLAAISAAVVLALTQPPERTPVLVIGRDLPAGQSLAQSDVTVRYVDDTTGLVVGDDIGELAGFALAVPVAAGEPLLPSILRPPEVVEAGSSMSLAVPVERAALGRLGPGDVVDIFVTVSDPIGGTSTRLVAESVYVIDAFVEDDPGASDDVHLLFAVEDELAPELARASHEGAIDLVRSTP